MRYFTKDTTVHIIKYIKPQPVLAPNINRIIICIYLIGKSFSQPCECSWNATKLNNNIVPHCECVGRMQLECHCGVHSFPNVKIILDMHYYSSNKVNNL